MLKLVSCSVDVNIKRFCLQVARVLQTHLKVLPYGGHTHRAKFLTTNSGLKSESRISSHSRCERGTNNS